MSAEYEEHKERDERAYLATFDKWLSGMSPAKHQRLKDLGISGAVIEYSGTAERDQDAADTPAASYRSDPGDFLDKLSDRLVENFALPHALAVSLASYMAHTIEEFALSHKAELFGTVCGEILNARNTKICVAGLAFASNLASLRSLNLKSQRAYARVNLISPAAVSKSTKRWQALLDLPHSPHMKDPEACANYAKVQSTDAHWRKQKVTAEALREMREQFNNENGKGVKTNNA